MSLILPLIIGAAALNPADSAMWQMSSPAYENPAVKQWAMRRSVSDIGLGWTSDRQSRAVDPQLGSGERHWAFEADTYLKYKSSTLWGDASYSNGKRFDVRFNETSDPELVYPYFTADTVGGDLQCERYRFGGGYADHRERWAWGASLHYEAGLYYRSVDPRPRNVTGRLDISVGASYRLFGDYQAGLSVSYRKYKQTNDIDFKNQMGVEKIYHLTGLGNHYSRFTGMGQDAYFNGHRWGLTVNLFPESASGFTATANMSRFSFTKILTELNKLPLADCRHYELTAQIGWLHPGERNDWALTLDGYAHRRHGYENRFGDAASNIYPLTGRDWMYADNAQSLKFTALWQSHTPAGFLGWIRPSIAYRHRCESYAKPATQCKDDNLTATLDALASLPCREWRLTASAAGAIDSDWKTAGATLKAARSLGRGFNLEAALAWRHTKYDCGPRQNTYDVSINLYF